MGLWFRRFEEGVWQLPHPHGHGRGDDSVFRVHHGVEKRLQVGLWVAPYMDDLVSGRRVMLARIHCPPKVCELYVSGKKKKSRSGKKKKNPHKKSLEPIPNFCFCSLFFFTQQENRKSRRQSVKLVPSHSRVEQPRTGVFFPKCVSCRYLQWNTPFPCCFSLAYLWI